jgi:ferric-dicitrate binding protein FerR (iron transport regulator)
MQNRAMRPGRRRFLRQLGMVGGAGAFLALGPRRKGVVDGDADARTARSRQDRGYRLTAHIRRYYEKAGL